MCAKKLTKLLRTQKLVNDGHQKVTHYRMRLVSLNKHRRFSLICWFVMATKTQSPIYRLHVIASSMLCFRGLVAIQNVGPVVPMLCDVVGYEVVRQFAQLP